MDFLDLRTILLSNSFSSLISTIVLFILWRQNRKRYPGIALWLMGFVFSFFGMLLLSSRGLLNDFLSIVLGNLLIIVSAYFLFLGFEDFYRKKSRQIHNIIILALFIVLQSYFTYIKPNLNVRNIIVTTACLIFAAQMLWFFFFRIDPESRPFIGRIILLIIGLIIVGIVRIIVNSLNPIESTFLQSNLLEKSFFLAAQMFFILLTFDILLLVNHWLVNDLELDITKREQAEKALSLSEEKYSKAFQSSPNAVLISKIKDGKLLEVNDSFCKLFEFSREEALNNSSLSLGFWVDQQDREKVVTEMRANSSVRNFEFNSQSKSGKIKKAVFSGEMIHIGGEECMLSIISDISEQKRVEKILQLRIKLWEYSSAHTLSELMQITLDEVEDLTGSKIGFYHFVDEEQNSLKLQAWSTRTKEEFCKAEGKGMQYSINEAGVWVDCIRQRKSVIHNDYSSLTDRKGLPEGHAKVTRELVVPTIHEGKIVSILGIGNKPIPYEISDVETAEYVSDMVWVIIEQKRAEEKILALNGQLEKMAMTDELTGLHNRRCFFIKGNEEISRSKRYGFPLSLIMLDIDRFKKINDTYGHSAGDGVLKCLAKIMKQHVREVDIPARLGGEEFCILLPNTTLQNAAALAERLRSAIETEKCVSDNYTIQFTASFGVAAFSEKTDNMDSIIRDADTAMYLAKNQGRNRVVIAE